ncbi:DUF4388 domain-containing protein [Marinithermus hydrothermalis]|uniref:PatA-like N-terminal domain-containing protein n=1 Tax=Marinithermus hydrothermalis (strain DSM 14884 / JCM 11576 / T1) TaxID=869210 RepID=F2NND6_MARHT|nr:DUF4388 domain-containing protein [Marinithermus hydrothermalis]AEB10977.1 hypothetical protein Marky_0216 [Marinithermus hydrothermalis DSM 14884]
MFKGNVSDFPLGTLVQTLCAAGRSGVLVVRPPWFEGRVRLAGGRVVHAVVEAREGMPALALLAGLKRAPFEFLVQEEPDGRTTIETTTELLLTHLLEATARWEALKHIPEDWGEVLRLRDGNGQQQLRPEDVQVLSLAEGQSVWRVLVHGEVPPLEVAVSLDRLIASGVLRSVPPLAFEAQRLVALPLYGPERGVAYVDEALYNEWARALKRGFGVRVRTPKGVEATFALKARAGIPQRIMLNDKDLRQLRLGRGVELEVWPEVL